MQQLTAQELKAWLDDAARPRPVILDVREPWEFEVCHLPGSIHMPMHVVPVRREELPRDQDIVVVCHHGARSFQVALFLERVGFNRLHNLYGGVDAWARHIDPAMATY